MRDEVLFNSGRLYPIGFSIPEEKIVKEIPKKDRDFALINPVNGSGYIYKEENLYYEDYRRSYFAITCKKAGWDCMRHYEILANGCIPYFLGLEACGQNTLTFLPKKIIFEAMNLKGVFQGSIDHSKFDKAKYNDILERLLAHTREHLSTKSMANYILKTMRYTGRGPVLYLSNERDSDYLRCLTLAGLKSLLKDKVIDIPKVKHIYKNYTGDPSEFYGSGFTYSKVVEDVPVDRQNIAERIKSKEFELVIYGSVHRGLRYHSLVLEHYQPSEIAYLCGEDFHQTGDELHPQDREKCACEYRSWQNLFLREFDES